MDLDDPKWSHLHGGYRVSYDPRKALFALEQADETASTWEELWTELTLGRLAVTFTEDERQGMIKAMGWT